MSEAQKKEPKQKVKKEVKYCKDPQAPKRFKSAFIFFTMDRHKALREKVEETKGKGDRTPDVAKLISEEWRSLKPEERAVWDEKARIDKERYEVEKAMYNGPWKIPSKKKSKLDPDAPKRPMSSFLSFSNTKRAAVKEKNPGIKNAEASKILAKMWHEAPEEEKRPHIEKEERLRAIYLKEIAEYRSKKKQKEEEKREKREEEAMNVVNNRIASGVPLGYAGTAYHLPPHAAVTNNIPDSHTELPSQSQASDAALPSASATATATVTPSSTRKVPQSIPASTSSNLPHDYSPYATYPYGAPNSNHTSQYYGTGPSYGYSGYGYGYGYEPFSDPSENAESSSEDR